MAAQFLLVEYNNVPYPDGYCSTIKEVAGHLDKGSISPAGSYSLHTEYSYGKRKFDSPLLAHYPALREAHKDGVPQLWKSTEWASEFASFILELTSASEAPHVVEIHPPFNDYCTIEQFAERFQVFEKALHAHYPETTIVIENRAGSVYHGGKFLFSKAKDIALLCDAIQQHELQLGIVLDFPQLLTAESIDTLKFNNEKYDAAIDCIVKHQKHIRGVHIWGKKKSESGRWVSHAGTLDTYFGGNAETKAAFLAGIHRVCDDGLPRFLVPEVNTGAEDLASIISDLLR